MPMFPVIDTHTHILSPPVKDRMKQLNVAPPPVFANWTPEQHVEHMELSGIAIGVLSSPGTPEFVPPVEAISLVRAMNEYFAELIQSYPTKFGAFATLPMLSEDAAVNEAVYALDTLGLDGVAFQSSNQGKYLSDPIYHELLSELDRRSATVLIHPILIPERPAGLSPALLEGTFDTTRNVTSMAVHRIFDRFPNINFIIPHTGGMVPYIKWRIAITVLAEDVNQFLRVESSKEEIAAQMAKLDRLYFDTAVNLGPLPKLISPTQTLFGTDLPFPSQNIINQQVDALFNDYAELGEESVKAVAYGNALKLFPRLQQVLVAR
ncbi:putative TIM-barrel fold metal-dependent hydrolase [Paenibacillus phyllosphaerae]|uniref:Putative TIM-barrel fold metal-dependent hydrolase n=1 Tax=Paenibacillus phyllosphaerae TaxID=274593 RepID=A0A7W5AZX1_9BACL|nr:amidohydrolase family protein [Paenibacillus phyllosphaerae]MBB3111346.1 putative TIM-barrel fold metal-dependent hydrolase [Paenibacillus phyllosphaerae]